MRGGPALFQQARAPEQERAGADADDADRARGRGTDHGQGGVIPQLRFRSATRDKERVAGSIGGSDGADRHPGRGHDRVAVR